MGEHTFEAIDEAAVALESMVRALDVATLTGPGATQLAQRLVRTERILAACRARALRRAAEANQWRQAGERSAAAWAAKITGTSPGQAAAELETTRQLDALPATATAAATGVISSQQLRELAAAATADPAAEGSLLRHVGIDDAAAFRRRCARVRAAAEQDEAAARERIRKARHLRSWIDAEGAFCFAGRGLAEDGAALLAALKPHQDRAFRAARRSGVHQPTEAYAYDALMALVRRDDAHRCPATPHDAREARRGASSARSGGEEDRRHRDDRPRPPDPSEGDHDGGTLFPAAPAAPAAAAAGDDLTHDRDAVLAECFRPGPRAKLIVRIDHTALVRGRTVPGEVCEIEGIGPVSVATARQLARDAFLTAVVTDGLDIKTVVHLGRAATAHQRTALEARGICCAVPGCGHVHGLEIDHVDGWAVTRRTHIDQLDWLCTFHHDLKTHKSYRLAGPPGARTWHPPGEPDP